MALSGMAMSICQDGFTYKAARKGNDESIFLNPLKGGVI
jgi:hypothetical protein